MTSTDAALLSAEQVSELNTRAGTVLSGSHDGRGRRVGIVAARFNGAITARLLHSALDALYEHGVANHDVTLGWVPGAFEIPLLAHTLLDAARPVDAVITLGAVIRGDTGHYEVVANECAHGVQSVQLHFGRPVVFGVLTVNTLEQALERSLPDATNKGREAALTALEMLSVIHADAVAK